jgi:hypothetical protein
MGADFVLRKTQSLAQDRLAYPASCSMVVRFAVRR